MAIPSTMVSRFSTATVMPATPSAPFACCWAAPSGTRSAHGVRSPHRKGTSEVAARAVCHSTC